MLRHLLHVIGDDEGARGDAKTTAFPPTHAEIAKLRDDLRNGAERIAHDAGSQLVTFTYKTPAN